MQQFVEKFWAENFVNKKPSLSFLKDWADAIPRANYEAAAKIMHKLAESGAQVGRLIPDYLEMVKGGRSNVPMEINHTVSQVTVSKQQYKEYLQKKGMLLSDQQVDDYFKKYDLNKDDQLSFEESVAANYAQSHFVYILNSKCPAPPSLVDAFERDPSYSPPDLDESLRSEVQDVVKKYSETLLSKAGSAPIEIVSTELRSIFQRSILQPPPDPNLQELANDFVVAMLSGQVAFIKVICGGSEVDHGKATFELWMRHEGVVFDKCDIDHNNMLDASELAKCIQDPPLYCVLAPLAPFMGDFSTVDFDAMARHFLDAFDVNHDGKISKAEWIVSRAAFLSLFISGQLYMSAPLPQQLPSAGSMIYEPACGMPQPMPGFTTTTTEIIRPAVTKRAVKKKRKSSGLSEISLMVVCIGIPAVLCGFVAGRWSRR